jgi:hypothetical protein
MATWKELEAQLEPKLRNWAKEMDDVDAQESAAEARFEAELTADGQAVAAAIDADLAAMHADAQARRNKIIQDMNALSAKINAAGDKLDADTAKAVGQAKADLQAQQAKMRADRERVNAQLKLTYELEVKHIKTQLAQLRARVKAIDEKNRARINAELDALDKEAVLVEQHIQQLHANDVALWNKNKGQVERAIADLAEGREKAMKELEAARAKAKGEFSKVS